MTPTEGWHLNRSVPIGIMAAIVIQGALIIGAYYQAVNDVANNAAMIERHESQIVRITDTSNNRAVQLGRIETSQAQMQRTLEKIGRVLEELK